MYETEHYFFFFIYKAEHDKSTVGKDEEYIRQNMQAYLRACREGEADVLSGLMMVVGGSGDGKSSFIQRISGEEINPEHIVTNALDAEISCKVNITKVSQAWAKIVKGKEEKLEGDLTIGLINAMDELSDLEKCEMVRDIGATYSEVKPKIVKGDKQMKQKGILKSIFGKFVKRKPSKEEPLYEAIQDDPNYEDRDDFQKNMTDKLSQEITAEEEGEAKQRLKDINKQRQLSREKRGEMDKDDDRSIIYVWDFGGQLVYYSIHQVFLRGRCVYALVINLVIPLDQNMLAIEGVQINGGQQNQTYMERIEFWLNLILSHMKKTQKEGDQHGKGCIVVVGTHKDCLHPEKDQQDILALQYIEKLKERLKNKQHKHLIRRYFAVDSRGGDEETYNLIREELLEAINSGCQQV